jgi:large subunit ribosomal protein L15
MKSLPKIKVTKNKRLGRGYGSGKGGHTVGRGQKGQKTRNTMGVLFEGVKMRKSFVKRLPFMRGKDKFKSQPKPVSISLKSLNSLPKDVKKVDLESLIKYGIVNEKDARKYGVKILGGELKVKLTIDLPISKPAAKKVKDLGGEVVGEKVVTPEA